MIQSTFQSAPTAIFPVAHPWPKDWSQRVSSHGRNHHSSLHLLRLPGTPLSQHLPQLKSWEHSNSWRNSGRIPNSSALSEIFAILVAITPRWTLFTAIPVPASFLPSSFANRILYNLEVAYARLGSKGSIQLDQVVILDISNWDYCVERGGGQNDNPGKN